MDNIKDGLVAYRAAKEAQRDAAAALAANADDGALRAALQQSGLAVTVAEAQVIEIARFDVVAYALACSGIEAIDLEFELGSSFESDLELIR